MPKWPADLLKSASYVTPPLLLLCVMAQGSAQGRYYIRQALYLSVLASVSVWGVFVSVVMFVAGQQYNINFVIARTFHLITSNLLNIRFEVEGEENITVPEGSAVLLGNHQTMLDIMYLGRIFPKRASIMAKRELMWSPGLGQYMLLSGAVFVNRSKNKEAVAALAAAGEKMKKRKISLWMFPEGTRHSQKETDMLPFKKGAFHLAVQAQVPIVPIVCQNYWHLYHNGTFSSGSLKIAVLPPISTKGLKPDDVPDLLERTRTLMLTKLREISGNAPEDDNRKSASLPASLLPESAQGHVSRVEGSEAGNTEVSEDSDAVLVERESL